MAGMTAGKFSATETEADHNWGIFDAIQLFAGEIERWRRAPKILNPQGNSKGE
jgi:hypothetical protein